MGLRTWTRTAIEEGDVASWFLGLSIGLFVEFLVAATFGLVGSGVFFLLFPGTVVEAVFGSKAFGLAWVSVSVALFLGYTRGKFTKPGRER